MKFVIDIPVHVKNRLEFGVTYKDDLRIMTEALANSIPLPKGHGDLIDANKIRFENSEFDTYGDYSRAFDAIDQAEVIIEADTEVDHE